MRYTRRDFGKLAIGALPAAALLNRPFRAFADTKPNSVINGVHVSTITYSYRSMPDQSAEAILRYVVESGISAIEFMGGPVEAFAGAPQVFRVPFGTQPNAEQQAKLREAAQQMRAWRTSVSMDRFKALRKMFNDAGVTIYAWKQLAPEMSDAEMAYVFNVAQALGCTHTTLELVDDAAQLKRIGAFAEKHKVYAAYHTHLQGTLTAFDQAFALSKGNMANVDFGHYVAGGNVGGMLAPVLTPWVSGHFGWPWGIGLGGIVCFLGALCWCWIDPAPHPAQLASSTPHGNRRTR